MTESWQLSISTPPEGRIIISEKKSQTKIKEGKIIPNHFESPSRKAIGGTCFSTVFFNEIQTPRLANTKGWCYTLIEESKRVIS